MFNGVFAGKKVFITGHTGFKGAWLSSWLLELGAEVCGYSDAIPTAPSMFAVTSLGSRIKDLRGDVTDSEHLKAAVIEFQPDFIFHLAAQALVSKSYEEPLATIKTNVVGVANILEAVRALDYKCAAVVVTSDKCYENVEWEWGYKETDHLGGKDVYSGSKGAAEVIFHSYHQSFFLGNKSQHIASARAGNVIGGGDWAKDRIVADCVRAWSGGTSVSVRSPKATRPWQHVLEPLSGYLTLAAALWMLPDGQLNGESFNFGPTAEKNQTVVNVIEALSQSWSPRQQLATFYEITDHIPFHEAGLLKLNCDKALFHLGWEPTLNFSQCISLVGSWYDAYYNQDDVDMEALTRSQINFYSSIARDRDLVWAQ